MLTSLLTFVMAIAFVEAGDEARLLHLHFLQHILNDLRYLPDRLGDLAASGNNQHTVNVVTLAAISRRQ